MNFQGFPKETIEFLFELTDNNNREWFSDNKYRYENYFKEPCFQFISALGESLCKIRPNIQAIPKINKSLFRLNKDVRFSKDKSPYKTHIGILLWEGNRKRMENSGFYFHVEPERIFLGAGLYIFPKELLKPYRDAVASEQFGPDLVKIARCLEKNGYKIGTEYYKKVPKDYDKDHPRENFLKFNGISTGIEIPLVAEIHSPRIVDIALEHFKNMMSLHEWVLKAF